MPGSPADSARSRGSPTSAPPWLQPGLIASLASVVEAEVARGTPRSVIQQRAWETGLALYPALPRPHLSEAVQIALWVGRAEDTAVVPGSLDGC